MSCGSPLTTFFIGSTFLSVVMAAYLMLCLSRVAVAILCWSAVSKKILVTCLVESLLVINWEIPVAEEISLMMA